MKLIMVALFFVFGVNAYANSVWVVSSASRSNESPVSYEKVERKILGAVESYKVFDAGIGAVKSWTCLVTASASTPSGAGVTSCTANLDLPAGYCWYGSFRLQVGFDPVTTNVTSLQYFWVKESP